MQIIKTKIRNTGKDFSIPLPLSSDENFNGLEQSINNFIEKETGFSINPAVDKDTFKFTSSSYPVEYNFNFYNGNNYNYSLLNAGFTQNEIDLNTEMIYRSFYIIQIYDSMKSEKQTLLHSGYYNGFLFVPIYNINTQYILTVDDEFTNYYLPNWYIDSLTGQTNILYSKFYFYNAKTGKLQLFYNQDNEELITEEKMYFKLSLNPLLKNYEYPSSINAKELVNTIFVNKINDTLDSFINKKPTYPSGGTFSVTGKYI